MCPHWHPEVEVRGPLNEMSVGAGPGVWQEAWPKGGSAHPLGGAVCRDHSKFSTP